MTTQQDMNRNPTGKGGFQDHPELINPGGRPKNQQSFTFWMHYFKDMSVEDFLDYEKTNPESKRFVAESIAYARVFKARTDIAEFKEVANRTEGMPKQILQHDIDDKITKLKIEIVENGTDVQSD